MCSRGVWASGSIRTISTSRLHVEYGDICSWSSLQTPVTLRATTEWSCDVSDDIDEIRRPRMTAVDEGGRLAVAGHALLSDIAAVRGAIELAMSRDDETTPDLLALAMRRLDTMAAFSRDLVGGQSVPLLLGDDKTHPSVVPLRGGTAVELYSAFNDTWASGFEIAEPVTGGYRVRRLSDGNLLPGHTSPSDLRVIVDRPSP